MPSNRNHWTMRHGMPTNSYSRQATFNYCPMDGRIFAPNEVSCPKCGTEREIFSFVRRIKEGVDNVLDHSFNSFDNRLPFSSFNSPKKEDKEPKPRWKKLLYIKQDYPDNYVDHTFLEEMQKNANVRAYDYWVVVGESSVVTQHLSSIVIFICAFVKLYSADVSVNTLITIGTVLSFIAYALWDKFMQEQSKMKQSRMKILTGSVLFVMSLLGLSPILKTLTRDTSDDTIWALTFCFFFINLLFHEYGSRPTANIKYPGSLSTNAAIFASVLLASRLPSNADVFGLMLFAIQWFALFPIFRRTLKAFSNNMSLLLALSLVIVAFLLLWNVSKSVLILYATGVLFITFVCPFWLIWIQRYKNAIAGPWDEARLVLSTNE